MGSWRRSGNPDVSSTAARRTLGAIRSFYRWNLGLLVVFMFYTAPVPGFAQVSREYQLKAVFLWRLAQFTVWPGDAFENADSPIVICAVGENPFGDALDAAVRDETAHGRRLAVEHYRSIDQIRTCHILFVTGAGPRQAKEITRALAGRSVLTVADDDGLLNTYDGMIHFVTEQNKIRLRINLKHVAAARLVLDPRLLRAAEIVANE
jgi:hypothetical protein